MSSITHDRLTEDQERVGFFCKAEALKEVTLAMKPYSTDETV